MTKRSQAHAFACTCTCSPMTLMTLKLNPQSMLNWTDLRLRSVKNDTCAISDVTCPKQKQLKKLMFESNPL